MLLDPGGTGCTNFVEKRLPSSSTTVPPSTRSTACTLSPKLGLKPLVILSTRSSTLKVPSRSSRWPRLAMMDSLCSRSSMPCHFIANWSFLLSGTSSGALSMRCELGAALWPETTFWSVLAQSPTLRSGLMAWIALKTVLPGQYPA